jgi:two-component system, OmpR family, response regulator
MAGRVPRVLVVEDEPKIRQLLEMSLTRAGFEVRAEADGTAFDEVVERFRPDVAVLDVWLGSGADGFQLARRLRNISAIPILFLTAAGELEHRLAGFDAGGSDYLTKPFYPDELVARMQALLALAGRSSSGVLQIGTIIIDEGARTVVTAGPPVQLTRTEFDLLLALANRPGRVLSKAELLRTVWGYEEYDEHLVEVHISGLRRKLDSQGRQVLHTVRGVGYTLRA